MKTSLRTRHCRHGLASLPTACAQRRSLQIRTTSTPGLVAPQRKDGARRASTVANEIVRESQVSPLPGPVQHTLPPAVQTLLEAIQTRHTGRTLEALFEMGRLLIEEEEQQKRGIDIGIGTGTGTDTGSIGSALARLPPTTFSELLRCFDPLTARDQDVAHGFHLGPNFAYHSPSAALLDKKGVRQVRKQILSVLVKVFDLRRRESSRDAGLAVPDYEVMVRCAAAAFEPRYVKHFFGAIAVDGLARDRTLKTWTDFLQGRFITEPCYYQFDRSRVALLPQDRKNASARMSRGMLESLERIRMHLNVTKRNPWNRDQGLDMRRQLRRYRGRKSMNEHFFRGLYYGYSMDEEMLCTAMVGLARSGSLKLICSAILEQFYGINVSIPTDPLHIQITGGYDFPPGSPGRPTSRLLHALVEAFGSMAHIPAALRLVDFVSRRWQIPIPAETWSNLLQWTHLHASRPFRLLQREAGAYLNHQVSPHHVRLVFNTMTSEPYRVIPTIDDYNVVMKTLLHTKSFRAAADVLRSQIMPYYRALVQQHEEAVLDEILQADTRGPGAPHQPSGVAASRRLAASAKKDYLHNMINRWCRTVLVRIQPSNASMARTTLPNLLEEFPDFFPPILTYRLPSGTVNIKRSVPRRHDLVMTERWTLPAKRSWSPGRDTSPEAVPWTWEDEVRVRGYEKVPRLRKTMLMRSSARDSSHEKIPGVVATPSWPDVERELRL